LEHKQQLLQQEVISPPGSDTGNATESWNGTSWTATPSINTARYGFLQVSGIQTAGIINGGNTAGTATSYSAATESWNGSTWTNSVNSL
jgi:hypothetical protein